MAKTKPVTTNVNKKKRAPARTVEDRENQVTMLAIDLAERQILDGTASSQVITHFLKVGSVREKLEREKLIYEGELLKAKTQNLKSSEANQELYLKAINAMKIYAGETDENDELDD